MNGWASQGLDPDNCKHLLYKYFRCGHVQGQMIGYDTHIRYCAQKTLRHAHECS